MLEQSSGGKVVDELRVVAIVFSFGETEFVKKDIYYRVSL
jgi:hypothetical protein